MSLFVSLQLKLYNNEAFAGFIILGQTITVFNKPQCNSG